MKKKLVSLVLATTLSLFTFVSAFAQTTSTNAQSTKTQSTTIQLKEGETVKVPFNSSTGSTGTVQPNIIIQGNDGYVYLSRSGNIINYQFVVYEAYTSILAYASISASAGWTQ